MMPGQAWARKGAPLEWEMQKGAAVVFDPETGATHFLSDLPSLLLSHIDDVPADLAILIERLDGPKELGLDERKQILSALLSLEQSELITSGHLVTD